jgi:uncharacterized membrane protein YccC
VGATVSIPFVAFFGQNLVAFGVAVFVTVVLCTILHLDEGLRLAAVTIAIIVLVPHTGHAWAPALNRFLEVSLGILVALLVAEFVLPSTALEHLGQGLAETLLQLDTFLSALLLQFRGENVEDVGALRTSLTTLARQNTDFHAHGRYEPARWSPRRITLVKLLQLEQRMAQAVETIGIACDGAFCGGIDPQWEPEFSALCDGLSAALQRIAEAILTRKVSTPEFDFEAAIRALDTKADANALNNSGPPTEFNAPAVPGVNTAPAAQTLEGVLRSYAIYFALVTLARELGAAQITARELIAEG